MCGQHQFFSKEVSMNGETLVGWANNLPEPEAQLVLLRAAKEYQPAFSNPDEIGMGWAKILREHGYNALGPYARDYLAYKYLYYCEDLHRTCRRIPVTS